MNALLVGNEPDRSLGYTYVTAPPYDTVVIGSLSLSQLLRFDQLQVLEALAEGKPVLLYTPGLPDAPKNWGVVFTDGAQRRLITAQEAKALRAAGKSPGPGAVLTPLAREILEGS